jgi:hypothetical protein
LMVTSTETFGFSVSAGDDWYSISKGLEQGSILLQYPIAVVESVANDHRAYAKLRAADVVVLTQSCDIPKDRQATILLAEIHDYDYMCLHGAEHLKKTSFKEALVQGTTIAEFLLPPHPEAKFSWSIVNFRDLYVVSKAQLLAAVSDDLCIRSPYREHLAQAFARFMMRVGLPTNLDEFKTHKPPSNKA